MRSLSLADALGTFTNSPIKTEMLSTVNSVNLDVETKIKQKIQTFTSWNYKTAILRKKKRQSSFHLQKQRTKTNNVFKNLIASLVIKSDDNSNKKSKKAVKIQQLEGVKSERRQRFKHVLNPMQIIQHYITKEGYKPSQQENILLGRIIDLREKLDSIQPFNLDFALQHIYKMLNIAVDLNQTKFLILIAMMAGILCFEAKQLKSSFFFLTQTMIAATCTQFFTIKVQILVYMGRICLQALQYQKAIIFFKKSLQYAWKVRDTETQLKIYDWIGQCLYYKGQAETALYYHNRYIQGETESKQSAVRRISFQMLNQYQKTIDYNEKQNINQLFIEYLSLPITNFQIYPPIPTQKIYQNYKDNSSPRKNRPDYFMDYKQLPQVLQQINKILQQFNQFSTEIPNPDVHRNFIAVHKYGRPQKNVKFEQSNDYHKIVGIKIKQIDKSILKFPSDEKAKKILEQVPNKNWWQDIVQKSKKQRNNKLGSIRNKVQKTHLSYHKYPQQRKKSLSYKANKINQTFNITILNWIDPPKVKVNL